MFKITFLENAQGHSPILSLIHELDQKSMTDKAARIELKQISRCLDVLAQIGTLNSKFTKHIREDLWELKAGRNRVLFFRWEDNEFVLLHYFKKKTQKTPQQEIETAYRRIRDWKNNQGR